jgi:hypothetical protein
MKDLKTNIEFSAEFENLGDVNVVIKLINVHQAEHHFYNEDHLEYDDYEIFIPQKFLIDGKEVIREIPVHNELALYFFGEQIQEAIHTELKKIQNNSSRRIL